MFDDTLTQRPIPHGDESEWKEHYGNVSELVPENAPKPRGKALRLTVYVDSDFAGCRMT